MRIAVLAEQNFNLIDGSTIWLLNVCKLLSLTPEFDVTLLLSHTLENPVLARDLPASVRVLDAAALTRTDAAARPTLDLQTLTRVLCDWEAAEGRFTRYLVRGANYLETLLSDARLAPRIVGYAPAALPDLATSEPDWLRLARASHSSLVVQSTPAKQALETLLDYPAHLVHAVPPVVFRDSLPGSPVRDPENATLCYCGKIDLEYGLDWLIDLTRRIAGAPGLRVRLIAGKDSWRDRNRDFFRDMDSLRRDMDRGALPHASIATGLSHGAAKSAMAEADFAWCLRHARYDDVIEISTKIVEFCSLGVAPILNDTALNRTLFGADYPYLIDILRENVENRVIAILRGKNGPDHAQAKRRIAEIAAHYSAERLAGALASAMSASWGQPPISDRSRHLLLATHDAKFLHQFLDRLASEPAIRISHQRWQNTTSPQTPPDVPRDVDIVLCEWACENAVWHSRNKRDGTRLIVRLHRFEAERDFPARINWASVDALIVVSAHFRDLMIARFGVDPARIHVIPQYINWNELNRPKRAKARFTLGLVGINPFEHKRFDRAIAFLAGLRTRDPRFQLAVRSVMPWQIDWVWKNRKEDRDRFEAVFRRIYTDPLLVGAVRFDPAGPDMEEWYRDIGYILSSSDSEGCHTSVMEGIASGCYPVVQDWPGAASLFAPHVHKDMNDAIDEVIAFAGAPDREPRSRALADSMRPYDIDRFTRTLLQI